MSCYPLHEIFPTLQGEGRNTGRPCIFVRFSGCNLACPWCDTDFSPKMTLSAEEILAELSRYEEKSVILTGGEPLLQDLQPLVTPLKAHGYWIGLETNGTLEPDTKVRDCLDYIATSPKEGSPIRLKRADEVRLVVSETLTEARCRKVRRILPADDYYLSPCDTPAGMRVKPAIVLLGRLNADKPSPPWRLSFQTHKLAGIP